MCCSTHAGLYSSSQLMAIVVKAGESAGRCGDHVGLNTFSGKGLFGERVRGAARVRLRVGAGVRVRVRVTVRVRMSVRARMRVRAGVGSANRSRSGPHLALGSTMSSHLGGVLGSGSG